VIVNLYGKRQRKNKEEREKGLNGNEPREKIIIGKENGKY